MYDGGGAAPTRHHPRTTGPFEATNAARDGVAQYSINPEPFTRVARGCNLLLSVAGVCPSVRNERHYETDSADDSGSVAETRRETGCPEPFFREAQWCTRRT
ncbi:hypothetical protein GCM10022403_021580 [Streptomyces coacervatus]|uniref:Uncharacterized protein n=1 Tax=Streptomyces coacervatus TaxID=647381 RepID=A0ABP7H8N2_9ACTN